MVIGQPIVIRKTHAHSLVRRTLGILSVILHFIFLLPNFVFLQNGGERSKRTRLRGHVGNSITFGSCNFYPRPRRDLPPLPRDLTSGGFII